METKVGNRKDCQFVEDVAIPEKFRARLRDYFRSGYDRGHQVPFFYSFSFCWKLTGKVPAADAKISQQAMDETFYLTNICPQVYSIKLYN